MTGQFGENDVLDATSDFTLRVTDGANLDVTQTAAADTCTTNARGRIPCKDAAKTYRVTFIPQPEVAGGHKVDIRLFHRDVTPPRVGPLTLHIDFGIPREGSAGSCRVDNTKLACKG